jgi:hypothetical protein
MPAAIPVVAGEAVLAAEVLAAEAAAAAAAEAASVAAAEAAAVAAAEQAAAAAATEAATTAAATEAATAAGTQAATGIEALTLNNPLPGQLTADQIATYTSGIPQAEQGVQVAQAGTKGGLDALLQSQAAQAGTAASLYGSHHFVFHGNSSYAAPAPVAPPPAPSTMLDSVLSRPVDMGGATGLEQGFGTTGIKSPD